MVVPINTSTSTKEKREEFHRKARRRDTTIAKILDMVFSQLPENPKDPIEMITLDFTPDE